MADPITDPILPSLQEEQHTVFILLTTVKDGWLNGNISVSHDCLLIINGSFADLAGFLATWVAYSARHPDGSSSC